MKAATKAAVLCAAIAAAFSAQAELKDFTVNGETVTKAQQEEQAKDVMAARRTDKMTPEIEAEVKRRLTRITAVAQAAKKAGLDKTVPVEAELANARNVVLYNSALTDFIAKHPVSDKTVKVLYDEERKLWGENEISVSHILVKTQKEAEDLIAAVKRGADFVKLAAEKSLDDDTKDNGGSLGWQSPSVFGELFRREVEGLKKGEVAAKPLQSGAGWHVIYAADVRPAQDFPSFDAKRAELTEMISQKMLQQYVEDLEKKAAVK